MAFHLSLMCLHFEEMPLITLIREYIVYESFAKRHHDFSKGTGVILRLDTDSEVAHKDID